jgi:hypothetical protein
VIKNVRQITGRRARWGSRQGIGMPNNTAHLIFGAVADEVKDYQTKPEQRAEALHAALSAGQGDAATPEEHALDTAYAATQVDFWGIESVLDTCLDMPRGHERYTRHYDGNEKREDSND